MRDLTLLEEFGGGFVGEVFLLGESVDGSSCFAHECTAFPVVLSVWRRSMSSQREVIGRPGIWGLCHVVYLDITDGGVPRALVLPAQR
ncbi:hypothetical protein BDZ89DRAFT_599023 [Hymenopellis radicata]|nr:hypothetical protein BDZ89DRAFT_599023 [Hymenopellis radicata]